MRHHRPALATAADADAATAAAADVWCGLSITCVYNMVHADFLSGSFLNKDTR